MRACHFKSLRQSAHGTVSPSVYPPIAEGLVKSHTLLSLLKTCSIRLPFTGEKERLIFGAQRAWIHFIRFPSPPNGLVKGAGSELTTFGSVPEQLAREAYQAPVIGFDLNLSPSHHPFRIKSSSPNKREAALGEAQPWSCMGVGERKGKSGESL